MSEIVKILLVEDDPNLGYVIKDNLLENGFSVEWVKDGVEGWTLYEEADFDVCLLDVMLPEKDGFSLATQIRENDKHTPILFMTAKGMQEDRLRGFEVGGDDYLVKPFSIKELIFRIEVFLKRSSNHTLKKSVSRHIESQIEFGQMTLDHPDLCLKINGTQRKLTQKEADLLLLFCKNKNAILKREDILKEIWGDDDYFMGRSLDVFISKIRKYLKEETSVEIQNYHGVGFKFQVK